MAGWLQAGANGRVSHLLHKRALAKAMTDMKDGERTSAAERAFARDKRPIALFDGKCNFCNTWVDTLLRLDTNKRIRLAALQSDPARELLAERGRNPDDLSSMVLVEEDGLYTKSEAVLRIGQHMSMPLSAAASTAAILPRPLRDGLYDSVASRRYELFGQPDSCRLNDPRFEGRLFV